MYRPKLACWLICTLAFTAVPAAEQDQDGDRDFTFSFSGEARFRPEYEGWRNIRSPYAVVSLKKGRHFAEAKLHRFLISRRPPPRQDLQP